MKKIILVFLVFILLFISCVSTKSSLIDSRFKRRIIPNNNISISLSFFSDINDKKIFPYQKDKEMIVANHSGYLFDEKDALERILNQYLAIKFPVQNAENVLELFVDLDDFWIEEYSISSTGEEQSHFAASVDMFFFEKANYIFSSKLYLTVKIKYNGDEIKKRIHVFSDIPYKDTFGSSPFGFERRHFDNINILNNRALFILNKILLEFGL